MVNEVTISTVVPGFRVLGFSALPGFRALKVGNGTWSVHKTLFGFRAPLSHLTIKKILLFLLHKSQILPPNLKIFFKTQESDKVICWQWAK